MLILYYAFLLMVTGLIFFNVYRIWKIDSDFTIPVVVFFMLYFSIGGAYIFPIDQYYDYKGSSIGLHYVPIFKKLFEVQFDWNYVISVSAYLAFILVFLQVYWLGVKKDFLNFRGFKKSTTGLTYGFWINPYLILLLTISFVLISFYLLRAEILFAINNEESIYLVTRANKNKYYTIHQLANSMSVLIPFIAYTFATLKNNRFNIFVEDNKRTFIIILFSCLFAALYIVLLGNRREVLSGIVICVLICLNNYKEIKLHRFGIIVSVCGMLFLANGFFRSTVIPKWINQSIAVNEDPEFVFVPKVETEADKIDAMIQGKQAVTSFLFSNELFYAHFSMYGALEKKVPITFGSSFLYLFTSIVPRAIYPNRPDDIYTHYAREVRAVEGQIYTIHHAAAWYLNFGFLGVGLGAFMLSCLFVLSYHLNRAKVQFSFAGMALLKFLIPFLLTSQIVTFITAGPEAYKAMLLEGVLIPVVLLYVCLKRKVIKSSTTL